MLSQTVHSSSPSNSSIHGIGIEGTEATLVSTSGLDLIKSGLKTSPNFSENIDMTMAGLNKQPEVRRPCVVFRLNGTLLYVVMISCPLLAVFLCVVISLWKDFNASVGTHCKVWNFLPTISAAMSCCTPQRYIWRMLIALHLAPRFMVSWLYYHHYMAFSVPGNQRLYRFSVTLNSFLHFAENAGLLMLSFVMSNENYGIHEKGFILFMLCSSVYMWLTLAIFSWSRSGYPWIEKDRISFKRKRTLAIVNVVTIIVSVYVFLRHNWYCEPGMYSVYAALEYLVVLSNIAFHGTAIYEFGQGELVFCEMPIDKLKAP